MTVRRTFVDEEAHGIEGIIKDIKRVTKLYREPFISKFTKKKIKFLLLKAENEKLKKYFLFFCV